MRCWVTIVRSTAEARALQKRELSSTALHLPKKQKLELDHDIATKVWALDAPAKRYPCTPCVVNGFKASIDASSPVE